MEDDDSLKRIADALQQLAASLAPPAPACDWNHIAYRWRPATGKHAIGWLEGIATPHRVDLDDLLCIDAQKAEVDRNTCQFLDRRGANNVLLWGSRGTGKSTLIKALLHRYAEDGLRMIEVDKEHLTDLPNIVTLIRERPERFIVYCDDLSFEADESGYKALKAVLEGALSAPPDNLLIYATSNRRHLLPEFQHENQASHVVDGELHLSEAIEEKISLSERFGLWQSFYPFNQDEYLRIVHHWLARTGADFDAEQTRRAALQWALRRGSRSGRVACQFAVDWQARGTDGG